jgi:hypothetical protein
LKELNCLEKSSKVFTIATVIYGEKEYSARPTGIWSTSHLDLKELGGAFSECFLLQVSTVTLSSISYHSRERTYLCARLDVDIQGLKAKFPLYYQ